MLDDLRCRIFHRGKIHFLYISNGYAPPDMLAADGDWVNSEYPADARDFGSCRALREANANWEPGWKESLIMHRRKPFSERRRRR